MMIKHVIKRQLDDFGDLLVAPIAWCGHEIDFMEWRFEDAQHVAMAAGKSTKPCKRCVREIVDTLAVEL